MQLRALIKTRKRKWAMIVLSVAVCAASVWVLLDAGHKPTDEEKYRRLLRITAWCGRLGDFRTRNSLPEILDVPLMNIQDRLCDKRYERFEELFANGYITELEVASSNQNASNVLNQIQRTCPLSFAVRGNIVFVTCRSNDAARILVALEKKP